MKSVAKEYASRGVTANTVAPGFITTDMTAAMPEAARAPQTPPSRWASPAAPRMSLPPLPFWQENVPSTSPDSCSA